MVSAITTLDFRQAQVNLINAELSLSRAKYDLKNQELRLLQLAGRLL
ncbi:MAG: TolC family protein [Flavobacteriales bacterium]